MADWMDGEVQEPAESPLTPAQTQRLMRLTAALREDTRLVSAVVVIKDSIASDIPDLCQETWCELEDHEQEAIWIAPKYGGIFTTEERKKIREWTNEAHQHR